LEGRNGEEKVVFKKKKKGKKRKKKREMGERSIRWLIINPDTKETRVMG